MQIIKAILADGYGTVGNLMIDLAVDIRSGSVKDKTKSLVNFGSSDGMKRRVSYV